MVGFRSVLKFTRAFDFDVVIFYNTNSADSEQILANVLNPVIPLLDLGNREIFALTNNHVNKLGSCRTSLLLFSIEFLGSGDYKVIVQIVEKKERK